MCQTKAVEEIKTHILCPITVFYLAVYEIMWETTVEPGRPQRTIWRMRIACWVQKVTKTHSEHAILIAVALQQWLHERAFMFRYTYVPVLFLITKPRCILPLFLFASQLSFYGCLSYAKTICNRALSLCTNLKIIRAVSLFCITRCRNMPG